MGNDPLWEIIDRCLKALKDGGSLIRSHTETTIVSDGPRKYLVVLTLIKDDANQ